MIGNIKKYVKLAVCLFVCFSVLKGLVYFVPEDCIKQNIRLSADSLEIEGLFPKFFVRQDESFYMQQMDNSMDSNFLNICFYMSDNGILNAMWGDLLGINSYEGPLENLTLCMECEDGPEAYLHYAREWWGMVVVVRPLLCFFTLPQIRLLSQCLAYLLMGIAVLDLHQKFGYKVAILFLFAFSIISLDVYASCINFAGSLYCVLISIIVFCKKYRSDSSKFRFMFIVGAVTAYLDCFACPFITLLVSLLILLSDYLEARISCLKEMELSIVKVGLGWLCGYVGLWGAKWIMASLVLKENIVLDALTEMKVQSVERGLSWTADTKLETVVTAMWNMCSNFFPINYLKELSSTVGNKVIIVLAVVVIAFFIGLAIKRLKNGCDAYFFFGMLLIGLIPYICVIMMHNHAYAHYWMWSRMQIITVIACGLAFINGRSRSRSVEVRRDGIPRKNGNNNEDRL